MTYPQHTQQYPAQPSYQAPASAAVVHRIEKRVDRMEVVAWTTLAFSTVTMATVLYFLYKFYELATAIRNAFGR